ncbi:DUF5615 family PIN-like protein [Candidatus Uhrbacteria bacterium]|nr:DUF5615 family PIN-like protein [Candidatus Uhrbacteria bacterium]
MVKFLLDENLSHETAAYLRTLGYNVHTVKEVGLVHTKDEQVIQYAAANGYLVVTFDVEYGYFFRIMSPHVLGIIVLRLENQTVEFVNAALRRLLDEHILDEDGNQKALIIVDENKIRVRK